MFSLNIKSRKQTDAISCWKLVELVGVSVVPGANPVVWDSGASQDMPILPAGAASAQNKAFSWSHILGEDDT